MKRFRLDVDLDWATLTCPCGSCSRTDAHDFAAWERKHKVHTEDGGRSVLVVHDASAWGKCFAGPTPQPEVREWSIPC